LLNRVVGSAPTTKIVLWKCLLDQIFYATQSDCMFLTLSAYYNLEQLPAVIDEVKDSFVTTWLMDCSLWPVVNFFGFAFVPYTIQPTYMAMVSYFWQLYMSSAAGSEDSRETEKLRILFDEIDVDRVSFSILFIIYFILICV
jgi:hypothetical protein